MRSPRIVAGLAAACLSSFSCTAMSVEGTKVIGGSPMPAGEARWIVSVQKFPQGSPAGFDFSYHSCGGSLVDERWVVTAAHCIDGIGAQFRLRAWIGGRDTERPEQGESIEVVDIIYPASYRRGQLGVGDIALLELERPPGADIPRVSIASPELASLLLSPGRMLSIAGWGGTGGGGRSTLLNRAEAPMVSARNCESEFASSWQAGAMCMGYDRQSGRAVGGCAGDSGGPVWLRHQGQDYVVGVVSGGGGDCAAPGAYTVATRVDHWHDWLQQVIGYNDGRVGRDPAFNVAYAGAWYEPDKSGQGIMLDVLDPDAGNLVFAAWFTFDRAPGEQDLAFGASSQRWFTAQGPIIAPDRADLTLYRSRDGVFDQASSVTTEPVGTLSLRLESCTRLRAHYRFNDIDLSGELDLQRVATSQLSAETCELMRRRQ